MGSAEAKIEAIEAIDREIASRVMEYARSRGNVRVAALPDHVTAVSTRKHAARRRSVCGMRTGHRSGRRAGLYGSVGSARASVCCGLSMDGLVYRRV